ncbi:hypothetical protein [Streptomyces hoynatensis]|uniref:Sortase n=1 Tax=Streptomyces hoynatensis TaxID=1141874 RepID=A0A3A9YTB8_9ACTN|nr:hypothetical protein [Streptomyces hoynatensis]RKN38547.1 hypothetical protein D7294_24060 [Streptomyces hoynatensis]
MSTLRGVLAAAGLSVTVLGAGGPAAAAPTAEARQPEQSVSFGFSVSPSSVRPGGAVVLTVTGCTGHEAFAESAVFDRVGLGTPGPTQSARTTVDADARVGAQYGVTFTCGSETASATLTIVSATQSPTPTRTATASSTTLPTRGAQAGAGGAQPESHGALLLAGAGLTAGAAATTLLLLRRRTRRHD